MNEARKSFTFLKFYKYRRKIRRGKGDQSNGIKKLIGFR